LQEVMKYMPICWVFLLAIDPQRSIKPFWPLGFLASIAFFGGFFVAPRFASRNVRLYIYANGCILAHASLDILYWEQVDKATFSTGLFANLCTLSLKNGDKKVISAFLEKQRIIKYSIDKKVGVK
jgi:hypothetical protein